MTESTTPEPVPPLDRQVVHVKAKHYTAASREFDVDALDATLARLGIRLVIDPDEAAPVVREVPAKEAREGDTADWTVLDGHANSSEVFNQLCRDVEGSIRSGAWSIVNGQADVVARTIVARLAHLHHFAPAGAGVSEEGKR